MKYIIAAFVLLGFLQSSLAEETLTEKVQVKTKTAKRKMTKVLHRTNEAICGKLTDDSKIQCLAKEAKNHFNEGTATVQDKASKLKNSADTEKNK